jgi:iron(II)-dependent oxidoreductase
VTADEIEAWVRDARARSRALVEDLTDDQWMGPRLAIVNPLRWETGHLAWFEEKWVLRRTGAPSLRDDADRLYDSTAIPHDVRWDLPLPSRADTLAYLEAVEDAVLRRVRAGRLDDDLYFLSLAVFHEDMHDEAFTYTRQTLGYPRPRIAKTPPTGGGPHPGDARVPGGAFRLGAARSTEFVFDNEKWEHEVEVRPFSIAKAPVTQAEYRAFVEDGGYARDDLWSEAGRAWRRAVGAEMPVYWRRAGRGFERRAFDAWRPLEPDRPVLHVACHEAEAFCRWAGRRLPTEAEWEVAAAGVPDARGGLSRAKRRFPWGDDPPTPARANLEGAYDGTVDVGALPDGDSAFGCRQMIGNVWEWTASAFEPYPGFVPDPYREYSEPWFHDHQVLRGGCFATRGRLLRNTWRNFYRRDRRDVLAGFRTVALDA